MKKMISALCILAAVTAYSFVKPGPVNFKIVGEIAGLKNDSVVLFVNNFDNNGQRAKPDTFTAKANDDKFVIEGKIAGVRNVWAMLGGYKSSKSVSFFLENGLISIKGPITSPDNLSITGTPANNDQTASRKITQDIYSRIQLLRLQLKNVSTDGDEYKGIVQSINTKYDSIQDYELAFIKANPLSMVSATYLYVKQDKLPVEELEHLYNNLGDDAKASGFGLIVKDKIKKRKVVAIGNMAPEFISTDTSGKKVKLTDFRGQYVLLEFWANWCVPCRAQSPHLANMYKKYKDKNFTIVQYSIDEKSAERKWKDAIIKDQLVWTQIADLSGFESTVAKMYGVQPIPDNFLIDPVGKIIGRRLEGEELEKKLNAVLNK